MILLIGDGIAPPADLVAQLGRGAGAGGRDGARRRGARSVRADRRRVALGRRRGGRCASARLDRGDARRLGPAVDACFAAPFRKARCGCRSSDSGGEPLLVESSRAARGFQRRLLAASRGIRTDWVSRYVLPPIEEFATEQLMETRGPAGLADLGGAGPDPGGGVLLPARVARRRAGPAARCRRRSTWSPPDLRRCGCGRSRRGC